jgi:hypothetical protein
MIQLRRYDHSGEVFACDPDAMTMSDMLYHADRHLQLGDYALDNDMSDWDLEESDEMTVGQLGYLVGFVGQDWAVIDTERDRYFVAASSDVNRDDTLNSAWAGYATKIDWEPLKGR